MTENARFDPFRWDRSKKTVRWVGHLMGFIRWKHWADRHKTRNWLQKNGGWTPALHWKDRVRPPCFVGRHLRLPAIWLIDRKMQKCGWESQNHDRRRPHCWESPEQRTKMSVLMTKITERGEKTSWQSVVSSWSSRWIRRWRRSSGKYRSHRIKNRVTRIHEGKARTEVRSVHECTQKEEKW